MEREFVRSVGWSLFDIVTFHKIDNRASGSSPSREGGCFSHVPLMCLAPVEVLRVEQPEANSVSHPSAYVQLYARVSSS